MFCLVIDLLDIEAYPVLDLACAYPMRWEGETVIGHHKTDMGAGVAVLRSKDPEGVAQEMWAPFAVYQAIHTLICAAVGATGIPPEGCPRWRASVDADQRVAAWCRACGGHRAIGGRSVVLVNHGVAATTADQPPVDRPGGEERHGQGES